MQQNEYVYSKDTMYQIKYKVITKLLIVIFFKEQSSFTYLFLCLP